jgi:hypothetical protein
VAKVDGAGEVSISTLPSFIFSGGTPSSPNGITGATTPNIITGNFLGYNTGTGALTEDNTSVVSTLDKFTSFRGVRFLGLWGDSSKLNKETLLVAMTTVDQPELLPVLQLNVPNAVSKDQDAIAQPDLATSSGINGVPTTGNENSARVGQWTIRPSRAEVNVYFVAGSTPSRNGVPYTTSSTFFGGPTSSSAATIGETGGGLANFVRFLENWKDIPIKITGGFIQNTKSRYATAPFLPTQILDRKSDITTIFLNPVLPGSGTTGSNTSGFDLKYMSQTGNAIPYYFPPNRLWGYDVGLLTQPPDRFAERFASPIAGANEFFREVSADDTWVEALLCSLETDPPVTSKTTTLLLPNTYKTRALRGNDLRSSCNSSVYGGATDTDDKIGNVYE